MFEELRMEETRPRRRTQDEDAVLFDEPEDADDVEDENLDDDDEDLDDEDFDDEEIEDEEIDADDELDDEAKSDD